MLATSTIPIFLALEPDVATAEQVRGYKARVRQLVGDQLYLSDPPHLTLYLAMFSDVDTVVDAARRCAKSLAAPLLSIAGWHTFAGDPLTGLNTLVLDFTDRDRSRLRVVQQRVVSALSINRDATATLDRINGRWTQLSALERESACRWGFPYVGDGWHPHLTVASIRPDDWPAVERELLATQPTGAVHCPQLQVFQLIDDEPRLLESFGLAMPGAGTERDKVAAHRINRSVSRTLPPVDDDIASLKREITDAVWQVADQHDWIRSATITGSFLTDETLASISDIDLVMIVDELNAERFAAIQQEFEAALQPFLKRRELELRINPTLGPLKFNDDSTAVLHLMLYSAEAHRQHVIKSPFTCFDWQRSDNCRKRSMAAVYPVFGLQPHHFVSARRGIRDYLNDFERAVVSYRELQCEDAGYEELRREAPMSARDRYEYAYHVMRFLMQNLLKLLRRENAAPDGDVLVEQFSAKFPKNADVHRPLYIELRRRKKARDFSQPIPRLADRLREFVVDFESQFRGIFFDTATRHVVFRHAATKLNRGRGEERCFVGRSDPEIEPLAEEELDELARAIREISCAAVYASPLKRCRHTIEQLGRRCSLAAPITDDRLIEIDYGRCDGFTVAEAKRAWPDLFAAWARGEDANFPGGENTVDVWKRAIMFADDVWRHADANTAVCTHNVVLRCLLGHGLSVPHTEWHRIRVPHLAPVTIVNTRDHGWFVDLDETVEGQVFANFFDRD
jgi:ribonuclease H / adenosylcobalamin/alpha-ribazole phosphatase